MLLSYMIYLSMDIPCCSHCSNAELGYYTVCEKQKWLEHYKNIYVGMIRLHQEESAMWMHFMWSFTADCTA